MGSLNLLLHENSLSVAMAQPAEKCCSETPCGGQMEDVEEKCCSETLCGGQLEDVEERCCTPEICSHPDECSDEVPLKEKEDCCENKEDCKEDETCCQLETDTTHMEEEIAAL